MAYSLASILPNTLADHQAVRRDNQKGKARKQLKAKKAREDAKRLHAFRDQVWARDSIGVYPDQHAPCANCSRTVFRTYVDPKFIGEVHHKIGRRNKTTRYNLNNGVILCGALMNDCHGKVQRHEIEL